MESVEINLHPKQFAAFSFKRQFGAAITGVRGGKTFCGSVWAAKKIQEFPTGNGLIAAPSYKMLSQATLETFFRIFPQYGKYHKQQQSVIELPSGGKVFIRSADDPYGLEGMTLDWAWADEAGLMKRLFWTIMRSRLSMARGQGFITTTPYSMNWLYQDMWKPWSTGEDKDIECFTWRSIDNPYFPKDIYDAERRRLSPEEFGRRYEGEFKRMEGLIWEFPDEQIFDPANKTIEQIVRYADRAVGSIDWGFSPEHPTGIVIAKVKDARYYVIDEFKKSGKTIAEVVQIAKELGKKYNVVTWYADEARPDGIEELRRAGLRMGDTSKDVITGLSHVGSLIREERLFISKNNRGLLDEMGEYHWDQGTLGEPMKERPFKVNDDLCDALRYLLMGYRTRDPHEVARNELFLTTQLKVRNSFE